MTIDELFGCALAICALSGVVGSLVLMTHGAMRRIHARRRSNS